MRRLVSRFLSLVLWLVLLSPAGILWAQRPIIDPDGIVNGASFAHPGTPGGVLAPGSIAVIFGENLAPETKAAEGYPLPFEMSSVRVRFGDFDAPLFEVSARQLKVQVPSGLMAWGLIAPKTVAVRVTNSQGVSDAVEVAIANYRRGLLTENGTGCGAGRVLNLSTEAPFVRPGPENSAWPGDWLRVYYTGLGLVQFDMPADGSPAEPTRQPVFGGESIQLVLLGHKRKKPNSLAKASRILKGYDTKTCRSVGRVRDLRTPPLCGNSQAAGSSHL
jgi:uncharacterized protein (TIGR03437 family)